MNSTPTPTATLELGVDTLGDVSVAADGRLLSEAQVIRDVIAEAELADSLGVDDQIPQLASMCYAAYVGKYLTDNPDHYDLSQRLLPPGGLDVAA